MLTWLKRFLSDESAFERYTRTAVFMLGTLIQQGVIPTGIDGGGKWGTIIQALALMVAAGQKNAIPPGR